MERRCVICGTVFDHPHYAVITCSPEHRKLRKKQINKEHLQQQINKEHHQQQIIILPRSLEVADRSTKAGWTQYMFERPIYFQLEFGVRPTSENINHYWQENIATGEIFQHIQ